jgi:hypothetical protein
MVADIGWYWLDQDPELTVIDNRPEDSGIPDTEETTDNPNFQFEQWEDDEDEPGMYNINLTAPYDYDDYPELRYEFTVHWNHDEGYGHLSFTMHQEAPHCWVPESQPQHFTLGLTQSPRSWHLVVMRNPPVPENFYYSSAEYSILQPAMESVSYSERSYTGPYDPDGPDPPYDPDDTRTPPPWPKPRVVLTAAGDTTYTMTLKSEYDFDEHRKIKYRLNARFGSNQETLTIVVYYLDEGETHQWAHEPVPGQFTVSVTLSEPRVMIVTVTNTLFTFISSQLEVLIFHPIVIPPEYLPKTHLSKELLPRAEPAVRVCFTSGPLKEWSFYVSKRIFEKALSQDRYTMAAIFNAYLANQCPEAASLIPTLDEGHPEAWDCVYWKVSFPNQYLFCL